jgi:hypothetical protein
MTQKSASEGASKDGREQGKAKRPYVKPDFRFEKTFETLALICGKLRGTGGACNQQRKNS